MRITLIGAPESGKTTFLGGLYTRFQSFRTQHLIEDYDEAERFIKSRLSQQAAFCISHVVYDSDREKLENLEKRLRSDPIFYPSPTQFSSTLPMDVQFRRWSLGSQEDENEGIFLGDEVDTLTKRVEIADMPGAAFTSSSKFEHEESLDIARESNAIIYVIDIETIADKERWKKEASIIQEVISEAAKFIGDKRRVLPVSIVVTKTDLFDDSRIDELLDAIFNEIVTYVSRLSSKIYVMLSPTRIKSSRSDIFNPLGLEYPFLFTAFGKFVSDKLEQEEAEQEKIEDAKKRRASEREARAYQASSPVLYWLDKTFGDQISHEYYANRASSDEYDAHQAARNAARENAMARALMESIAVDAMSKRTHVRFAYDGSHISARNILRAQ